jgi:hypothetical protein
MNRYLHLVDQLIKILYVNSFKYCLRIIDELSQMNLDLDWLILDLDWLILDLDRLISIFSGKNGELLSNLDYLPKSIFLYTNTH